MFWSFQTIQLTLQLHSVQGTRCTPSPASPMHRRHIQTTVRSCPTTPLMTQTSKPDSSLDQNTALFKTQVSPPFPWEREMCGLHCVDTVEAPFAGCQIRIKYILGNLPFYSHCFILLLLLFMGKAL